MFLIFHNYNSLRGKPLPGDVSLMLNMTAIKYVILRFTEGSPGRAKPTDSILQ